MRDYLNSTWWGLWPPAASKFTKLTGGGNPLRRSENFEKNNFLTIQSGMAACILLYDMETYANTFMLDHQAPSR